jgi:hypothetical protein
MTCVNLRVRGVIVKSVPAAAAHSISGAAQRMRRSRQRRQDGLRSLRIELHETEVDALIEAGILEPVNRNEPNAVTDAVHQLLDRVLPRTPRHVLRPW